MALILGAPDRQRITSALSALPGRCGPGAARSALTGGWHGLAAPAIYRQVYTVTGCTAVAAARMATARAVLERAFQAELSLSGRRRWPRSPNPARRPCRGREPARCARPAPAPRAGSVCSRTWSRNQSRNCGAASTTPPPTKYTSGSVKLAAIVNSRPMAMACCAKISSASGVTGLAVPADQLRRGARRADPGELVLGEPGQPVRQQVLLDPGQRGNALGVTRQAAVARRDRLPGTEQPVHRDPDVPELAGHSGRSLHHLPALDHAAAEAGADDRGHRGAPVRLSGPKNTWWAYSAAALASLLYSTGMPEPALQRAADVEAAPVRVAEVRCPARRDHAFRADRARRVQAHRRARSPAASRSAPEPARTTGPAPRSPFPGRPGRSWASRPSGQRGTCPRSRARWRCSSFRRCRGRPPPTDRDHSSRLPRR